jgi:hypothetical protein
MQFPGQRVYRHRDGNMSRNTTRSIPMEDEAWEVGLRMRFSTNCSHRVSTTHTIGSSPFRKLSFLAKPCFHHMMLSVRVVVAVDEERLGGARGEGCS